MLYFFVTDKDLKSVPCVCLQAPWVKSLNHLLLQLQLHFSASGAPGE